MYLEHYIMCNSNFNNQNYLSCKYVYRDVWAGNQQRNWSTLSERTCEFKLSRKINARNLGSLQRGRDGSVALFAYFLFTFVSFVSSSVVIVLRRWAVADLRSTSLKLSHYKLSICGCTYFSQVL